MAPPLKNNTPCGRSNDTKVQRISNPTKYLTHFNIFICMRYEQVNNSYIFKIIKRALKTQYPWIIDVELDEHEFDNYKTTMFLNLYIDPRMLGDEYGWTVAPWVKPGYDAGSTIGMFFKDRGSLRLNDEVDDFMWDVTSSPAIPDDLKPPPPKNNFSVGSYISI